VSLPGYLLTPPSRQGRAPRHGRRGRREPSPSLLSRNASGVRGAGGAHGGRAQGRDAAITEGPRLQDGGAARTPPVGRGEASPRLPPGSRSDATPGADQGAVVVRGPASCVSASAEPPSGGPSRRQQRPSVAPPCDCGAVAQQRHRSPTVPSAFLESTRRELRGRVPTSRAGSTDLGAAARLVSTRHRRRGA